jgi:cell division protein FtsB
MALMTEIRRRAHLAVGPLLGAAAVAYFGFHMVQGDRGLIAWWHLNREIVKAEATLQRVAAERSDLAHRVALLRPGSLDPDLLDERVRAMLNLGRPDERIIPLSGQGPRSD